MELIGWAWMFVALGLVLYLLHMYILAICSLAGACVCFVKYARSENLEQRDIIDTIKTGVNLYRGVL
jgi:hypothetical protein